MSYMFEYETELAPGVKGTRIVHLQNLKDQAWEPIWWAFCKEEELLPSCLHSVSKVAK